MGFPGMDFAPVSAWCAEHGVPYTIVKTDIREIVFDARQRKTPVRSAQRCAAARSTTP